MSRQNKLVYILDVFLAKTPLGRWCKFLMFLLTLTITCFIPIVCTCLTYLLDSPIPFPTPAYAFLCFIVCILQVALCFYCAITAVTFWFICLAEYQTTGWQGSCKQVVRDSWQRLAEATFGQYTVWINPFSVPVIQILFYYGCLVYLNILLVILSGTYEVNAPTFQETRERVSLIVLSKIAICITVYPFRRWIKGTYFMITQSVKIVYAEYKNL